MDIKESGQENHQQNRENSNSTENSLSIAEKEQLEKLLAKSKKENEKWNQGIPDEGGSNSATTLSNEELRETTEKQIGDPKIMNPDESADAQVVAKRIQNLNAILSGDKKFDVSQAEELTNMLTGLGDDEK